MSKPRQPGKSGQPSYAEMAARFNAFSPRERAMIAAVAVGGVLFLGFILLIDPQLKLSRTAQRLLGENRAELATTQTQLQELKAQLALDPDAEKKAELIKLRQELAAAEAALKTIEGGLVPPEKMNALLERLLARHASLRLIRFKSLPPLNLAERAVAGKGGKTGDGDKKPADAAAAGADSGGIGAGALNAAKGFGVYKHGVELVIEGNYADLYAWLEQLEAAPQKMLWGEVRLQVEEHPRTVLSLTVFTLSSDKAWLTI